MVIIDTKVQLQRRRHLASNWNIELHTWIVNTTGTKDNSLSTLKYNYNDVDPSHQIET
jgi:hypothetical protein